MNSSAIISELIYSLSNLLVLFNDRIIEHSKCGSFPSGDRSKSKLKILLTTLEYCEVFIELTARKVWGERGRWFFITVVQLVKCIGRMVLRFRYHEGIIQSPPLAALDRKNVEQTLAQASASESVPQTFDANSAKVTFTLKRSGRVVRKVEGSPPVYLRSWKALTGEPAPPSSPLVQSSHVRKAELLFILKPLIHLSSVGLFGLNSWKSYSVAVLVDLISLRLYRSNLDALTPKQRLELSRRSVAMLLYLIRSPFYEKFTQRKLHVLLDAISCTIPFSKTICEPLAEYIPHWQQTYFYMWSS